MTCGGIMWLRAYRHSLTSVQARDGRLRLLVGAELYERAPWNKIHRALYERNRFKVICVESNGGLLEILISKIRGSNVCLIFHLVDFRQLKCLSIQRRLHT